MVQTITEPATRDRDEVPTCHGGPMRRKEGFVTGLVFYACPTCNRNDYSMRATKHN